MNVSRNCYRENLFFLFMNFLPSLSMVSNILFSWHLVHSQMISLVLTLNQLCVWLESLITDYILQFLLLIPFCLVV